MNGSLDSPDQFDSEANNWINGFIRQNCEEARNKVLQERNRWVPSEDEDEGGDSDLTRIFNEETRSHGTQKTDATDAGEDVSWQELDYSAMLRPSAARDGGMSSDETESKRRPDDTRTKLPEGRTNYESEFIEMASLGITHPKERLFRAIREFNSNIVEMERVSFMQLMIQIEDTVNEVLDRIERLDSSFRIQRMSRDSYYDLKSRNEIDIFIVIESISPDDFIIEDMKTPTGYARIRLTASLVDSLTTTEMTSSSTEITSATGMTSAKETFVGWCTEWRSGELYLSPKKLCKRFASLVSRAACQVLTNGARTDGRRVTFSDKERTVPFITNLIPTIACPQTWPLCAYWLKSCTRKWPESGVKDHVVDGGMHLAGFAFRKDHDPLWCISFCAARRQLLASDVEGKRQCLRILKVLLNRDLIRPRGLVPVFLENIVLWASRKHWRKEEWDEGMLPERCLEMLVALQKCLENNDCYNFFVPTVNLFGDLKPEAAEILAAKVKNILQDPFKYLSS